MFNENRSRIIPSRIVPSRIVESNVTPSHRLNSTSLTYYDPTPAIKAVINNDSLFKGIWNYGRSKGTTIFDSSYYGHNITLSQDKRLLGAGTSGGLTYLTFDSIADYFTIPDHNDFSFGDGSTDSPFSIVMLIAPTIANGVLFGKFDITTGNKKREYYAYWQTNKIQFYLYDNSADSYIGRTYGTSLASDSGNIHCYIFTYSGNSLETGISIYRDGIRIDDTHLSSGSYTAMENLGANIGNYYIAAGGTKAYYTQAKKYYDTIIGKELTPTEAASISTILTNYADINFETLVTNPNLVSELV